MKIESESELMRKQIVRFLKAVLLLPVHLLEMVFRPRTIQRKTDAIKEFMGDFLVWLFQAQATTWLIILIILAFITSSVFLTAENIGMFVFHPEDVLELNIIPMFTSFFLHANLAHLLGNVMALFVVGRVVERKLGSANMVFIFFGSALISQITHALIYTYVLKSSVGGIGASGAIAGLVGAAILIDPFYFTHLAGGLPLPVMLVGWLYILADITAVLNPVAGDNVGHFAHLGGYIAITFLVFFLDKRHRSEMKKGLLINLLLLALAVTLYNIGILQKMEELVRSSG